MYYFSIFHLVDEGENANMEIRLDDVALCTARGDHNNNGASDAAPASCSVVADLVEGTLLHSSQNFAFEYSKSVCKTGKIKFT